MKRSKLIRHLRKQGCTLSHEGGRHSIFANPKNGRTAPVPRHSDVDSMLVLKICKELEIDPPGER